VATTTGTVRDPAPTTPARVSTATNPASASGALLQHHQPPAPPPPTVSNHVAHLQQTRITPLVEQSRAYHQSRPAGSAADDHHGRFYTGGGRRDRLGSATPGLWTPVLERGTTMVQAADMTGTTGPAGVGSSARVCCLRARTSMRLSQGSSSTSSVLSSMAARSRNSCWGSSCSPLW